MNSGLPSTLFSDSFSVQPVLLGPFQFFDLPFETRGVCPIFLIVRINQCYRSAPARVACPTAQQAIVLLKASCEIGRDSSVQRVVFTPYHVDTPT